MDLKTANNDKKAQLADLFHNITTIINNYRIEIVQYNNSKNTYEALLADLGIAKSDGEIRIEVPEIPVPDSNNELDLPNQMEQVTRIEPTETQEFTPVIITEKVNVPEEMPDDNINQKDEAIKQVIWSGSTETTIPGVGVATEEIRQGETYRVEYQDEMMGVQLYKFIGIEGLFEAKLFNELDKTMTEIETKATEIVESEVIEEPIAQDVKDYRGMKATSINESSVTLQDSLKSDFNGKGSTIARGQGVIGLLGNSDITLPSQAVVWGVWGIIELIDWTRSFYLISEARNNLKESDIKKSKKLTDLSNDNEAELSEAFMTLTSKMEDVETRTQAGLVLAEAEGYGMVA